MNYDGTKISQIQCHITIYQYVQILQIYGKQK